MFCFPAEFLVYFLGVVVEFGGVAGAAGAFFFGVVDAGDAAGGVYDFADGVALADADVVRDLFAGGKGIHGGDMGVDEVFDMDIIADAGAIRRGVVRAVDGDMRALAEGDFEADGNEMGFGFMVLADAAL